MHRSEMYAALLEQFAVAWGAAAWRSYKIQGRGVFVVHLQPQQDNNVGITIDYMSPRRCKHTQARQLAKQYDPAHEYVLLIGHDDSTMRCATINLNCPLADLLPDVHVPTNHHELAARLFQQASTSAPAIS